MTPQGNKENKEIEKIVLRMLKKNFTIKMVGDTPTDDLQFVNRKYVNLSGSIDKRPASLLARVGQQYFDTTNNRPMFFDGSKWRDGVGSIIASN